MHEDLISSLESLRGLHAQGILSDAAFEQALERLRTRFGAAALDACWAAGSRRTRQPSRLPSIIRPSAATRASA